MITGGPTVQYCSINIMWENLGGSIDLGHMTQILQRKWFFFVLSSDIHWVITKWIFLIGITIKDKIWDGQFRLYELVKETTYEV